MSDDIEDTGTPKDRKFVEALARGLDVLRAFTHGSVVMGNQDIARITGLPKPTVSRMTYTLTKLGYLSYSQQLEKYQLDSGVLALGYAYVSNLRRLLTAAGVDGRQLIEKVPPGYRLNVADDDVDLGRVVQARSRAVAEAAAGRFEQASEHFRTALALWRDSVLADLRGFAFAESFAIALDEDKVSLSISRAQAEIAAGRADVVIPELEALVVEHPYREPLWAQLITKDSNWRWNGLLIGLWNFVGLILLLVFYKDPTTDRPPAREVLSKVDYIGGFLSIVGVTLFMAGLQWGARQVSSARIRRAAGR